MVAPRARIVVNTPQAKPIGAPCSASWRERFLLEERDIGADMVAEDFITFLTSSSSSLSLLLQVAECDLNMVGRFRTDFFPRSHFRVIK